MLAMLDLVGFWSTTTNLYSQLAFVDLSRPGRVNRKMWVVARLHIRVCVCVRAREGEWRGGIMETQWVVCRSAGSGGVGWGVLVCVRSTGGLRQPVCLCELRQEGFQPAGKDGGTVLV